MKSPSLGAIASVVSLLICVAAWISISVAGRFETGPSDFGLGTALVIFSYTIFLPGGLIVRSLLPPEYWLPYYYPLGLCVSGVIYALLIYGFGSLARLKARLHSQL